MAAVSISVFFPCYDEEAQLRGLAARAVEVLEALTPDWELIIVDDCSRDRTGAIADELAATTPRIRVIHHEVNRGYGGALQSGIRAARNEIIFFTDGDGQFDLAELPPLVPLLDSYDLVVGWRLHRRDPWPRRLFAWCWTRLVNALFGMEIRDVNCAFKLFRRRVFEAMPLESEGALISAEILARATRRGYRIAQRPVHHYPRTVGRQTGAQPRVIARAFWELLALRQKILTEERREPNGGSPTPTG